MKKNNELFKTTLFLMTLLISSQASSANNPAAPAPTTTPATTPNSQAPSKTQKNTGENSKRVMPTPQNTRVQALEANLRQNQLNHQINILQAAGTPFLTLYRSALTGDSQGCAILLHADNEHPDWPSVISPLRNALPKYSWCTLSIEVPDITKRAEAVKIAPQGKIPATSNTIALPNQNTVFARIQAAIADAEKKGNKQFVFIGYGTGAAYAMHFLSQNKTSGDALVLIDIESPTSTSDYDLAQDLTLVEHPVLDYYYDRSAEAHRFAVWRKQAANQRKGDTGEFIQLDAIEETKGMEDGNLQVIQRVRGFLKQYTSQTDQLKPLPEYKKGLFYESP